MTPQKRVCTSNRARGIIIYTFCLFVNSTHRLDFRFTFSWVLINNYAPAQMVWLRSSKQTSYLLCQPVQYYRRFIGLCLSIFLSFFLSSFYICFHILFSRITHALLHTVSAKQLRGVYVLRVTRAFQIAGQQKNWQRWRKTNTNQEASTLSNTGIVTGIKKRPQQLQDEKRTKFQKRNTYSILYIIDLRSNIISNHDWITKFGVRDFLLTKNLSKWNLDDMQSHAYTQTYAHACATNNVH